MLYLNREVDSLYDYRDNFFNLHDISKASEKPAFLKEKLESVLEKFEEADESCKTKAEYFMLKGKALNVTAEYNAQAEKLLSKAVKLDPMMSEAWTCLGDCYWKNDCIEAAKNCFVSSMSHKKNKEALRYLSTITRALSREKRSVEDSLQMAKEALEMDLTDGSSWLNLGNAYLAQYFGNLQDPAIMKQALSAYNKAEQDSTTRHNYTLYYNKACAHEYFEDFAEALSLYHMANQLNPTFPDGQSKESNLIKYLQDVTTLVQTKGKLHHKRLKGLVDKIKPEAHIPTHGISYKNIKDLSDGPNPNCLLVGRVVGSVFSEDRVCQAFCLVDKDSTCTAVTLYNASNKWALCIGDAVVVKEPSFKVVSVPNTTIHFPTIRINLPTHLLVNGRMPDTSSVAPIILTQTMHSE